MAEENDETSSDPGDGTAEYTYGGGTGDYEVGGDSAPGTDGLEDTDFEDDGVLDSSDTLEDSEDPYEDPLDPGVEPADKWSAGERFGDTLAEERQGESLDQLLAEEDPEPDPYADPDPTGRERPAPGGPGILRRAAAAGRPLVAEDEGAHPDTEPDLVAQDVGIDGGGAGAEEAAVHMTDEDEDEIAGGPEG